MKGVQTRGGAILLWRLGPLKFQSQRNYAHRNMPASKGLWAFPYPYWDDFFTWHQYAYLLPKNLKQQKNSSYPADISWYEREDGKPLDSTCHLRWVERENGRYDFPLAINARGEEFPLELREGFYDAQSAWIRTVGKKILPIRKFWYEGDLYSHISTKGVVGNPGTLMGETDWYRMDARTLARVLVKTRGDEWVERRPEGGLARGKYSKDHLELFIPAHAGQIRAFKERN